MGRKREREESKKAKAQETEQELFIRNGGAFFLSMCHPPPWFGSLRRFPNALQNPDGQTMLRRRQKKKKKRLSPKRKRSACLESGELSVAGEELNHAFEKNEPGPQGGLGLQAC